MLYKSIINAERIEISKSKYPVGIRKKDSMRKPFSSIYDPLIEYITKHNVPSIKKIIGNEYFFTL